MKGLSKYFAIVTCPFFIAALSHAQSNVGSLGGIPVITGEEGAVPDWFESCTDPKNKTPISTTYAINFVGNELFFCSAGAAGTWTAGGGVGTATTPPAPCFEPNISPKVTNAAGKFAFSYGYYAGGPVSFSGNSENAPVGVGSLQQYSAGFHNADMAINFGAPTTPAYCYANFLIDNSTSGPVFFGQQSPPTLFYAGESNRYMTYVEDGVGGDFNVDLQIELVADAVRFRWACDNVSTASHTIALWFCSGINMLDWQNETYWAPGAYAQGNFSQPYLAAGGQGSQGIYYGPDAAGEPPQLDYPLNGPEFGLGGDPDSRLFREDVPAPSGYEGIYIYLPNQRPPDTDIDLNQATDPTNFPAYADFVISETDAFGIRIETQPSTSTNDTNPTNVPSKATELTLGKNLFIIGDTNKANPIMTPTVLIPDTGFLDVPAFVIKYQTQTVQAGSTYQFLNYVRSTWGNASYALPFGAVVDAPAVVQEGTTNYDGTPTANFNPSGGLPGGGLIANTFAAQAGATQSQLIRVWIDNVGGNVTSGYGVKGKEFTLDDIQVNLSFPTSTTNPSPNPGVKVVNTGGATQTISSIAPRTDGHVDFYVQFAQDVVGQLPYTVTINTVPQNTKVISGIIEVSGRPQLTLYANSANLVAAPYVFGDSSWISILSDFTSTSTPGVGAGASVDTYIWDADLQGYYPSLSASRGNAVWVVFNNPNGKNVFAHMEGAPTLPANFDSSTQQIELKPGWNLIANPFDLEFPINQINGVASSNPDTVYNYNELVGLGYISGFVAAYNPPTQSYNYVDGANGDLEPNTGYWIDNLLASDITISYPSLYSEGSPGSYNKAPAPPLAAGLWRLSLTATEGAVVDSATVGTAATPTDVRSLTIYKAPTPPNQKMSLGIYGTASGKTTSLAQALSISGISYGWSGYVNTAVAGAITLKWPSVTSVPTKFGVFLVDLTSGATVDMRASSSYSFAQIVAGLRRIQVIVKGTDIVTNLITSLTTVTKKVGTVTDEEITYKLALAATTTTTVLNAKTLAVVATPHANRLDAVGSSIDLWNMKSTLGQALPAGQYIVRVSAVTSSGIEQTKSMTVTVP